MKIKNKALANSALSLRYTRDENGIPLSVQGDAEGIFEIAEKDALFLLATPGWAAVGTEAPVVAATAEKKAVPAPVAVVEEKKAEEPAPQEEELPEGPDLTHKTKAQLLDIAAEYGVGIPKGAKVEEIRSQLNAALYGGE